MWGVPEVRVDVPTLTIRSMDGTNYNESQFTKTDHASIQPKSAVCKVNFIAKPLPT